MVALKIFISHSITPKNMELINNLEQQIPQYVEMYVAERDKKPGNDLKLKIEENIRTSDILIALLTKGGENNDWVNQEIGFAHANKIPIIPIRQKGVRIKGFIDGLEWVSLDMRSKKKSIQVVKEELIRRYNQKVIKISEKEAEDFRNAMLGIFGIIALIVVFAALASR